MPRKPAPKVLLMPAPQTGPQADPQSEGFDLLAELEGIEGGLVVVHRIPAPDDKDQTPERIASWPASQFSSLEALQDHLTAHYGGGKFQIRGRNARGQWIGASTTVRLVKTAEPAASPLAAVPAAAAPAPAAGFTVEAALKFITVATPLLTALIGRPNPPPVQGLSAADVVALSKLGDKQPSMIEQVQTFAALKDAFAGDDKPASGSSWLDLMNTAIKNLGPVVQQQMAAMTGASSVPATMQPGRQAEALPLPMAMAADPSQQAAAPQPSAAAVDPNKVMLQMVLDAARAGSDPAAYAVLVADRIGDDAVQQLLSQPDPVAVLCMMVPGAGDHRDWCVQLVEELRGLYEGEVEEQDAAAQNLPVPEPAEPAAKPETKA